MSNFAQRMFSAFCWQYPYQEENVNLQQKFADEREKYESQISELMDENEVNQDLIKELNSKMERNNTLDQPGCGSSVELLLFSIPKVYSVFEEAVEGGTSLLLQTPFYVNLDASGNQLY